MKNPKFKEGLFIKVVWRDSQAQYYYHLYEDYIESRLFGLFTWQDSKFIADTPAREDALSWARHYDIPCPDHPKR